MFKDFNISSFKKMKPPSDNSFDTMQEVKEIKKIPLNKKFVKDNDHIDAAFKKTAKREGVENYDANIAANLIKKSAPIIMKLKKHFNRPRPKVTANKMKITMKSMEMDSMKTPSYPSGHSTQGILIGKVLAKKYPQAAKQFMQAGKNISKSRNIAKAHYKSDSKMGEQLGSEMFEYIKNKV